jgi:hypothetical protein
VARRGGDRVPPQAERRVLPVPPETTVPTTLISCAVILEVLFTPPAGPESSDDLSALPSDWLAVWGERAAVLEYDGGLPRERAEPCEGE